MAWLELKPLTCYLKWSYAYFICRVAVYYYVIIANQPIIDIVIWHSQILSEAWVSLCVGGGGELLSVLGSYIDLGIEIGRCVLYGHVALGNPPVLKQQGAKLSRSIPAHRSDAEGWGGGFRKPFTREGDMIPIK